MALFNFTTDPASTAAAQIASLTMQQFNSLARSGVMGFNLIWNNKNATPQQVLTALGTNAKAIFELANLNITTVQSAASIGGVTAPVIPSIPTGWTITFNDDGSATAVYSEEVKQ